MKKILGLDLGTTSIGWALVNQAEAKNETTSIIRTGVRVNPLSSDELGNFEKGKAITTNADRTAKRAARRNLQRYKLRRDSLLKLLKKLQWIGDTTSLSENGKFSTYQTYELRARAAKQEISLEELSRVLLMINKKRGYKSSRKTSAKEEGYAIDGMAIAKRLYDENLTPGQLSLSLLESGHKLLPDYYRSDLSEELDRIWATQSKFHSVVLTDAFKEKISGKSKTQVTKLFREVHGLDAAENKGKDKKVVALKWRTKALSEELPLDEIVYVISDVCGEIANSSGYLGAISDRSKELYFNHQTVGEYLYSHLCSDKNFRVKDQVFYRQDYLDEFEKIWEIQSWYHKELTAELKHEIRDIIIFYQRRLKSQKGLVNFCVFENRCKVAPRSSFVFQEFKVWQTLNNLKVSGPGIEGTRCLSIDEMECLANELKTRSKMKIADVFLTLFGSKKGYEANYKELDGNRTFYQFYSKFIDIVNASGNGEFDIEKMTYGQVYDVLRNVFEGLNFNTSLLDFDSSLQKDEMERQPLFKLWHLLYSYEGDNSKTGDKSLVEKIGVLTGMPEEYARMLTQISFKSEYSSLSNKAITTLLPFLKKGNTYDVACMYAGDKYSKNSLTREEIENKVLVDKLSVIKRNSLRNPVVEKILNQMINVINQLSEEYGKPDEIHIEMARSLKQTAKQREEASKNMGERAQENEKIIKILKQEFHIANPSKNDILKYRLYEELCLNNYKALYSDKYISREELFTDMVQIEHIIPRALLFNDSFNNKTLEYGTVNRDKDRMTANDYVASLGEERYKEYVLRVENLYKLGQISKTKRANLLMAKNDIPEDFVLRDLTCTQYIAKIAKEMLESYVKTVVPTNGQITERLRNDWQLVDVMKELSLPKYRAADATYFVEGHNGQPVEKITDWTKRNDHRHHAMDALTVALTTISHIHALNTLSARDYDSTCEILLPPPMPLKVLRAEFKKNLESTLVSIKAKNKVVTNNVNKTTKKDGTNERVCLTPRGPLHKEQVYGLRKQYETFDVPVSPKLTQDTIEMIASPRVRGLILSRLEECDNDFKKAFSAKNLPESFPKTIKCVRFKDVFSIRKDIDPNLSIDKVIDVRCRHLLQERLKEFGGDAKKAFANLEENPIWLNKEKGIQLKKVTIAESFDLSAIHYKKDKDGNYILDKDGNRIPVDFVNLKNNHHVAIYEDADGNYQESVVSFFEALERVMAGQNPIDKNLHSDLGWKFKFSLKINEMFVFPNPDQDFYPENIDLLDEANYAKISPNLYRVQKLSSKDYYFRHHLETMLGDNKALQNFTWKRIRIINNLKGVVKVRINHIGKIVSVAADD